MSDGSAITKEQLANLNRLVCERFLGTAKQLEMLKSFQPSNNIAASLIDTAIKYFSSGEDKGKLVYYIIRDEQGVGYAFFSLRTGSLFDHEALGWIAENLKRAEENRRIGEEKSDIGKITDAKRESCDWKDANERLEKDLAAETRDGIVRVMQIFGGIEIVQFCKNEKCVKVWRSMTPSMGSPARRMGEVLFWYFVVPRILDVLKMIGAEVVYLFAADETEDEKLRNYYRRLGFTRADSESKYACLKDLYELESFFMYLETSGLESAKKAYFSDFNHAAL